MNAVIYARVSSTDESQSYERQIDDLKRWAEYLQLDVIKIYAEKVSGFQKSLDERVEFNKMLDFIEKNQIKHIMVSELSRLSRRFIDTVNFIHDCTKKGITIHFHKESLSTLNSKGKENAKVQMITSILSSMAQEESESLSFRIKSGKQFSASKGGGFNSKIYGYDKGEDGKPVINEEQAVLVKKMFEMVLNGDGMRTIANFLNENYDTKKWTISSVHSIVRNSFYCGKRKYNKLTIAVPAIISEETFNQAQEFKDKRKRFVGRVGANVNPFASFIRCECGATMNQIVNKGNNLDLYRCAKKCGVKSVNRPFLIKEVKKVVEHNATLSQDETVRNQFRSKIEANLANITTHEKEIRSINLMSDKNYERLLSGSTDEIKYNEFERKFQTKLKNLDKDIKILKESIRAIETSLKGEIFHYSDDLSVFKKQLLNKIEWIEIKKEIAVVKIKGWAKVVITIKRGSELYLFNLGKTSFYDKKQS